MSAPRRRVVVADIFNRAIREVHLDGRGEAVVPLGR